MMNMEPRDTIEPQGGEKELQQSLRSLRTLVNLTVVALIILSGSLSIFFLREVSHARRQIRELTRMVDDYNRTSAPLMDTFTHQLQDFARSHPDFRPILHRYLRTTNAVDLPAPSGVPPDFPGEGSRLRPR
jgi:predicted protein tyrosine phosphatase